SEAVPLGRQPLSEQTLGAVTFCKIGSCLKRFDLWNG
ncbi:hypothetical protein A2U01_0113728, partial [Trifolium medium]|nr:hypothetical protein [Trifolium medium]